MSRIIQVTFTFSGRLNIISKNIQADLARIPVLVDLLNRAETAYRIKHQPIMTDGEFDTLMDELIQLEGTYPLAVLDHSPTRSIGSDSTNGFKTVVHRRTVGSLKKFKTDDEFVDWLTKNGLTDETLIVEPKLDGLTLVLTYQDGILVQAVTRGNGVSGDDVTPNAMTISTIPKQIPLLGETVIRGEVIIHNDDLEAYNTKYGTSYSVARNLASGSLRLKTSIEAAERPLRFVAFDIMHGDQLPQGLDSMSSVVNYMNNTLGFVTPSVSLFTSKSYFAQVETWKRNRPLLPYDIDGMVISVDSLKIYRSLGFADKRPRGSIAYKFASEAMTTVLEDVEFTISRSGRINPVGILRPINLGGALIGRVSLHNFKKIAEFGLHIGDTVSIKRSNDVIPMLTDVMEMLRPVGAVEVTPPTVCPSCEVTLDFDGTFATCVNPNCKGRNLEVIIAWVEKVNMDGVAGSVITKLFEAGLVESISDLYAVQPIELLALDGVGSGIADNFFDRLDESRNITWDKILASLPIDKVGKSLSSKLMENYGSLWDALAASDDELKKLDGVGDSIVSSLKSWVADDSNAKLLEDLEAVGFNFTTPPPVQGKFNGMQFAITGTLTYGRDVYKRWIEDRGGKVGSVTKSTNYLITDDPDGGSSKLQKARKNGTNIIDENQLYLLAGERI